jgi:hypothetical protein
VKVIRGSPLSAWIDRTAVDPAGRKVGKVVEICSDDRSPDPRWLVLTTGVFGMRRVPVPIDGTRLRGDDVEIGYHDEQVRQAPTLMRSTSGPVIDEFRLCAHYGVRPPVDGRSPRLRRWPRLALRETHPTPGPDITTTSPIARPEGANDEPA